MAVAKFKPSNFKLFMSIDLMRVVLCVMMLNKISQKWPLCVCVRERQRERETEREREREREKDMGKKETVGGWWWWGVDED